MSEHKDLLDTSAHTHTPQGFTAASNNTTLHKNSSGILEWVDPASTGENPHIAGYHQNLSGTAVTLTGTGQYYHVDLAFTDLTSDGFTSKNANNSIYQVNAGAGGHYLMNFALTLGVAGPAPFSAGNALKFSLYVGTSATPNDTNTLETGVPYYLEASPTSGVDSIQLNGTLHVILNDLDYLAFMAESSIDTALTLYTISTAMIRIHT